MMTNVEETREDYQMTELGKIPIEWKIYELDEIVDKIVGGGTPSRENEEYYSGEIPWFTVKDMDSAFFELPIG
jgi:type I restriction enzyme, S subunit